MILLTQIELVVYNKPVKSLFILRQGGVFIGMPLEVGKIVEGKVTGITNFGAFIELPGGQTGLVHISEVADAYVKDIKNYVNLNEKVKVKVIGIDAQGKISLSIKQAKPLRGSQPIEVNWGSNNRDAKLSFEDKLAKFLKESDEKQQMLRKNHEAKRGACSFRRREE